MVQFISSFFLDSDYSDSHSDSFFNPHELTKIVLRSSTKFYGVKLNHLVKRTEPKTVLLFFRVIYNTGRDQRVPFSVFWHCETFFGKKFFPKGCPFNFVRFCERMDVEKSQMVPSDFWFCETPKLCFGENFSMTPKGLPFNFLMFCDKCLKLHQGPPFSAAIRSKFCVFGYC